MKKTKKSKLLIAGATTLAIATSAVVGMSFMTANATSSTSSTTAYSCSVNSYVPFNKLDIDCSGSVDITDFMILKNYILTGATDSEVEETEQYNTEFVTNILGEVKTRLSMHGILSSVKDITINADIDESGRYDRETATVTVEFYTTLGSYNYKFIETLAEYYGLNDIYLAEYCQWFKDKYDIDTTQVSSSELKELTGLSDEELAMRFLAEKHYGVNAFTASYDTVMSGHYDSDSDITFFEKK
jgi:hypothetical protein